MISLRPATNEDCLLIFKWANNSEVRNNSFSPESIDLESHIKWYENKMKDDKSIIFIALKDGIPVGQIRVDKDNDNDEGFIDCSIDPNYRGQGIGTYILQLIKSEVRNINLVGYIKKENISSIKACEKAGYTIIEYDDFVKVIYKS